MLAALCLAIQLVTPSGTGNPPEISCWQLPCGVRVMAMEVPGAQAETFFTFHPLHLGNDAANHPQWSHLVEHLLIRSTDPDELNLPGIALNGETMGDGMRLESIADPDKWKEALERHAKWLHVTTVDPAVLKTECERIDGEVRQTSLTGFTHKWAIAAWNQVARHGLDTVDVKSSIHTAAPDTALQYLRDTVALDSTVHFAAIGPVDVASLHQELDRLTADLTPRAVTLPAAKAPRLEPAELLDATWDLDDSCIVRWIRLRDDGERGAAEVASQLIAMSLQRQDPGGKGLLRTLVIPSVVTPEGVFMLAIARAADATEVDGAPAALSKRIGSVVDDISKVIPLSLAPRQVATMFEAVPDFAVQRSMTPPQYQRLVECQWLLQSASREFAWGCPREQITRVIGSAAAGDLRSLIDRLASDHPEAGGTLRLTSRVGAPPVH